MFSALKCKFLALKHGFSFLQSTHDKHLLFRRFGRSDHKLCVAMVVPTVLSCRCSIRGKPFQLTDKSHHLLYPLALLPRVWCHRFISGHREQRGNLPVSARLQQPARLLSKLPTIFFLGKSTSLNSLTFVPL